MKKNYFNGYNYTDANLKTKNMGELKDNIKAIKRDRIIAVILRIVMVILALRVFAEPLFTNLPVMVAVVLGIALLYLATTVGTAICIMDKRLNDNMNAINHYGVR